LFYGDVASPARRGGAVLIIGLALLAVTVRAIDSSPPLIQAVKAGDHSAVRLLLKQRTDVNLPEADGTTALHWAVRADDREMVTLLLKSGAKAEAVNRYGSRRFSSRLPTAARPWCASCSMPAPARTPRTRKAKRC